MSYSQENIEKACMKQIHDRDDYDWNLIAVGIIKNASKDERLKARYSRETCSYWNCISYCTIDTVLENIMHSLLIMKHKINTEEFKKILPDYIDHYPNYYTNSESFIKEKAIELLKSLKI